MRAYKKRVNTYFREDCYFEDAAECAFAHYLDEVEVVKVGFWGRFWFFCFWLLTTLHLLDYGVEFNIS